MVKDLGHVSPPSPLPNRPQKNPVFTLRSPRPHGRPTTSPVFESQNWKEEVPPRPPSPPSSCSKPSESQSVLTPPNLFVQHRRGQRVSNMTGLFVATVYCCLRCDATGVRRPYSSHRVCVLNCTQLCSFVGFEEEVPSDIPHPRPPPPPSSGTADPGVVKQDKSSGGSVDTTQTRSDPQRVRRSSGERPIGAAKGKQPNTEALCQTPHPPSLLKDKSACYLTPPPCESNALVKATVRIVSATFGAELAMDFEATLGRVLPARVEHALRMTVLLLQERAAVLRRMVQSLLPHLLVGCILPAEESAKCHSLIALGGCTCLGLQGRPYFAARDEMVGCLRAWRCTVSRSGITAQ